MISGALLLLALVTPLPSPTATYDKCSHDAQILKPANLDPLDFSMSLVPVGGEDYFAIVAVTVAPNGSVKKAKISSSSGNITFDQASIHAARRSTYGPKMVDCVPVEGIVFYYTSQTGGYAPGPHDSPTPPVWPKNVTPPPSSLNALTPKIRASKNPYDGGRYMD